MDILLPLLQLKTLTVSVKLSHLKHITSLSNGDFREEIIINELYII